ncbi:hypothetical protein E4K67_14390 [Desulfosporosinus fructosivorans]|uniref:Uncharacterized protein n=1 Tax=Desulfosporosinus fructosivorans TaxID=2018669 RepID=A0A4Z0R8D6_9FIRM|nr:hypothetical protein [Desulfosporosinus fructosivorans]TGE37886.1 hypothetical protein E4K67_14390 [Desulfosporosinus fructosivorans]
MSRYIIISLVLIIGLGVGSIVPVVTSWWYDLGRNSISLNSSTAEAVSTEDVWVNPTYHFGIEQGVLSVIEGAPGASGKAIVTGLNVQTWPKEMVDIAPKVEFYSLDEVQSFIDTVNETLWLE